MSSFLIIFMFAVKDNTPLFLRVLVPIVPPPHPTLARQLSSPKPVLSGTSELLFFVEERQPAAAECWGGVWRENRVPKQISCSVLKVSCLERCRRPSQVAIFDPNCHNAIHTNSITGRKIFSGIISKLCMI